MPADIVTGQDLDDVAAYVGEYAGVPGAAPPEGPRRPRRPGLRQQRLRRLPHLRRRRIGRRHRPEPRRSPARPDRRDDRRDRSSTRTKRSPRATRPNVMPPNFGETISAQRTRRPRRIPDRKHRRRQTPAKLQAAEPRRPRGRCDHCWVRCGNASRAASRSPRSATRRSPLVALGALALIVLTGAGVRLTGSGLGCPDWPKCYGGTHAAARNPRGDRVRQPAADRVRRLRRDRRQRPRLLPPALPLAPGAVRRPAAARGDRPGDPRRPGRQVPPRAGAGDVPLHPLDDAARRGLRARLVLALRTLGAAALAATGSASGRCGR